MEDQNTNKKTTRFTRTKTEDISNLLYGKIPPQARELEEAVLGAILIESDAMFEIADFMNPKVFYVDAHATIYESMEILYNKNHPIDLLTVTEQLRKEAKLEEVGGAYYLSELTNRVASSSSIEYHARLIIQKFIQREVIRICNDGIRQAYDDITDVFDLLDKVSLDIMTIEEIKGSNIKTLNQIKRKIKKELIEDKPLAKLFKLGFDNLDFLSKTFNIIAGYQGTGKTAFILSAAKNLAQQNWRVGILSAEMSEMMLGSRSIQADCSISSKRIITNTISDQEKEEILNIQENSFDDLIFVDDSTDLTHKNIITKVKTFIQKHKVDIIFIDYMQLIEVQEKGVLDVKANEKLSNRLQSIGKKLDISVIGLSQLSRVAEKNEKPTENNLRGGGLEQAASDIFILYDEYWKDHKGIDWKDIPYGIRGKIEVIYAKGRYTQVSNKFLYFDKPKQTIYDWNDKPEFIPYSKATYVQGEDREKQNDGQSFDIF
ncbi:MAG: DnaB-like helicase C-terminal domain-containing protein [Chitinophagales bacterium]